MKTLLATLILLLGMVSAFAQSQPNTLAGTMKAMASTMKIVATQATNAAQNGDSANLCDQFIQLITHAKSFTPDTITALPEAQQAAQKADYDKMLDQAQNLGTQLAEAFRANDNAKAADILNQLVQSKKDAHAKYK